MRIAGLSVRVRLTLWYSAAVAMIILGFSCAVYSVARKNVFAQAGRTLERDLATVAQTLETEAEDIEDLAELRSPDHFQVTQGDRLIYQTRRWDLDALGNAFYGESVVSPRPWSTPSGRRLLVGAAEARADGRAYRVRGALDLQAAQDGLRILAGVLVVGVACSLGVAVLAGLFLARRALRPVDEMASTAERISAESLSERMPVRHPEDEFGRLATVFNRTLVRLEDSFGQLRRFTQDAAHELRTPLAIVRSTGEAGLARDIDAAGYRDVISSMLEELDRLTRLVDDLLTLARADSGQMVARKERVDLSSLARDVAESMRPLAEEKGQTLSIRTNGTVCVDADPAILRLALTNIVDNAVSYTQPGGHVSVEARRTADGKALIEIADDGPGIPAEHRTGIFQRFYRVDKGRARDAGGTGLGLAIAQRAVQAHGGRIEACPAPGGGSVFRITLAEAEGGEAV